MGDTPLAYFVYDVTYDGHRWLGTRAEAFAVVAARTRLPWPIRLIIRPFKPGSVVLTPEQPAFRAQDGTISIPSVQMYRILPTYGLRCTGEIHVEDRPQEPFSAESLKHMIDEAERQRAEAFKRMESGEAKPNGWVQPIDGD